jgi:uncharacterized membrane protein YhiD involved in acid resistance
MNRVSVGVLATFVVILLGSGLFAYLSRQPLPATTNTTAQAQPTTAPGQGKTGVMWELFGIESGGLSPAGAGLEATASRIALRFSLAAFLAGLLAFRPRRGSVMSRRNPFVAQTQILMAVVAAAMMMVVGDSAARAFGIFAAASLVRFRTNIRDPKEITVLLICLAVGLAAGVGRWDMALILTMFVLLTLAVLEFFERSQVFRSLEVSIATKNVDQTNKVLMEIFEKHGFDTELCELDREDEDDPLGKIVYMVALDSESRTGKLSEEILAANKDNIDSIEWQQKESKTYMYK